LLEPDPGVQQKMFRTNATGGGTLVVMVPTSAGLVIAADSRMTFGGLYCDNISKITEIEHRDRMAFVVTGYSTVWNFANVPIEDICKHVAETRLSSMQMRS
jgi:20S proteasome alpha/beta subunit